MSVYWLTRLVLGLVAISVVGMMALIINRLVRTRIDRRRRRLRDQTAQALIGLILAPGSLADDALLRLVRNPRLMAEVVLELQVLVRGSEREQAFSRLRELGLAETFIARFNRNGRTARLYAEALGALGGTRADEILARAAASHPNPEVRITALRSAVAHGRVVDFLGLMRDAGAGKIPLSLPFAELVRQIAKVAPREAITAAQMAELPRRLRSILFDALGSSRDYDAIDPLIAAASEPDPELRIAAIRGLGKIMHPAAAPVIAAALRDPEWAVRTAAAEAVGRAKLSHLAEALAPLLSDTEWWVRCRAAEALRLLGDPGEQVLRGVAASGPAAARAAAQAVLVEQVAQ